MNLMERLIDSVKTRGGKRTVQSILSVLGDRWFDWRYGTETSREVALAELDVPCYGLSENIVAEPVVRTGRDQHVYAPGAGPVGRLDYQPARMPFFHRLLRRIQFPPGSVFVDLGAGKGRTLLMAAQHGFRRAIGVEFSAELCEVAERNIRIFRRRIQPKLEMKMVRADVAEYGIGDDENVFFISPFGGDLLRRVLDNIHTSLVRAPRKVWLIYYNPYSPHIIDQHGAFAAIDRYAYGGGEAIIYSNSSAQHSGHA